MFVEDRRRRTCQCRCIGGRENTALVGLLMLVCSDSRVGDAEVDLLAEWLLHDEKIERNHCGPGKPAVPDGFVFDLTFFDQLHKGLFNAFIRNKGMVDIPEIVYTLEFSDDTGEDTIWEQPSRRRLWTIRGR